MLRFLVLKSLFWGGLAGGSIQAVAEGTTNDAHTQLVLGLFSLLGALGVATIAAFATVKVARRQPDVDPELEKENTELRRELRRKDRIIKQLRVKMEDSSDQQ